VVKHRDLPLVFVWYQLYGDMLDIFSELRMFFNQKVNLLPRQASQITTSSQPSWKLYPGDVAARVNPFSTEECKVEMICNV